MSQPASEHVSLARVLFIRARFLMVFLVIGFLVSRWEAIGDFVERWTSSSPDPGASQPGAFEWFCPMHPNVVRDDPTQSCPICGMALSKRPRGVRVELPGGTLARLQLSPYRIAQAGVATIAADYRLLVREIRSVGFIEYDERRVQHISARIAGRAEELYVNFTGVRVKSGDPVYKLYSPDLIATQQEYLQASTALAELAKAGNAEPAAVERARQLIGSARERLSLWGLTATQLDELEQRRQVQNTLVIHSPISGTVIEKDIHAGHYLEVGEDPYTIVDDSVIWVVVEVFERDLGLIALGQTVEVKTEAYPGERFSGSVSFVSPGLNPHTRTVKVRVDVPNPDARLKAGMYVFATMRVPLGKRREVFYTCCSGEHAHEAGKCSRCEKQLERKGGLSENGDVVQYRCPMHPEVTSNQPGKCPRCGMALVKVAPVEPGPDRSIWVCDMHPDRVYDRPGRCERCGGMELVEKRVMPDSRLVYVCPDHPDVVSEQPGHCPQNGCGKPLDYAIASPPTRVVDRLMCDMHPGDSPADGHHCPECNSTMDRVETEEVLSVPFDAVIDTGSRHVVYVERSPGIFDAVEVELGPRAGEYYAVIKGLAAGDRVVTAGAFLLDAETRLNPAAGAAYFGASGSGRK